MFIMEVPCCKVLCVPINVQCGNSIPVNEQRCQMKSVLLLSLALLTHVGYEIRNVNLRSSDNSHPCGVLSVLLICSWQISLERKKV